MAKRTRRPVIGNPAITLTKFGRPENEETTVSFHCRSRPAGCTAYMPEPTAEPVELEISPSIDGIFLNETVEFRVVNIGTREPLERAGWSIVSPHNVPGDRGVVHSGGRYTALRRVPYPPTVRIRANSGGRHMFSKFQVRDPTRPDPNAPGRPGDSYMDPVHGAPPDIRTSRPIKSGLRVGESVRITAFDRTGRPVVVSHHEIVRNNRGVDYAGTITPDGVYTAPSVVPDLPRFQINILYLLEGGEPGSPSLLGKVIEIVP